MIDSTYREMAFLDDEHKKKIKRLEKVWGNIQEYSVLGKEFGIEDIFQDNGGKILQQLILTNFEFLKKRSGNDARDENNREWELKSANILLVKGFSTHHHLTEKVIDKFRKIPWLFSLYENINLIEIYALTPDRLEPFFLKWESKLKHKKSLNNPKIPVSFVQEKGFKIFPLEKDKNPALLIESFFSK